MRTVNVFNTVQAPLPQSPRGSPMLALLILIQAPEHPESYHATLRVDASGDRGDDSLDSVHSSMAAVHTPTLAESAYLFSSCGPATLAETNPSSSSATATPASLAHRAACSCYNRSSVF